MQQGDMRIIREEKANGGGALGNEREMIERDVDSKES